MNVFRDRSRLPNRSVSASPSTVPTASSPASASAPAPARRPLLWLVWGNWGPYHHARLAGLRAAAARHGLDARGLELVPRSDIYAWDTPAGGAAAADDGVHHLPVNRAEMEFNLRGLHRHVWPLLRRERPAVVFVPSYWHWSLWINFAARLGGAKIVMMNESHGATARARGPKHWLKRAIVRSFHAALVGGTPHRRYFAELGLPAEKIFTGYDAIDHDHFARAADAARADETVRRAHWGLPARYFLNLGRMVAKKNLARLIDAFAAFRRAQPAAREDLVFVGSGELEAELRAHCAAAGLDVVERTGPGPFPPAPADSRPRAFFYGFRQIADNPMFYAFASAFILPSHTEEWGLVVNEALSCGTPALVSRAAGCAEDLVLDDRTGFQFDPLDSAALAALLARLADPATVARLGGGAREHAAAWGPAAFGEGAIAAARAACPKLFAR